MKRLGTRWRGVVLAALGVVTSLTAIVGAPSPAPAAEATVGTSVVSGLFHTCVLMADASVKCWGDNVNGQIGDGGNTGSIATAFNNAPAVAFAGPAASVVAGGRHSCALKTDGTVWCWGKNDYGQLGQPISTAANGTPTQVAGLSGVTSVSAGEVATCAAKTDGTVWCWGADGLGQLGVPTAGLPTIVITDPVTGLPTGQLDPYSPTPKQVVGLTGVIAVDAGDNFACALKTDGSVACWGDNGNGQLGRGTAGDSSTTAATVDGLDRVAGLTSGRAHACARKTSGTVFCWGANDSGQLGTGDGSPHWTPEVLPTLGSVTSIAASEDTTCGVRATGQAVCWGSNTHGQLGNGTKTNAETPVNVVGLQAAAVVIAPGWNHTCALLVDQRVTCWGADDRGQLANGQPAGSPDSATPIVVAGLTAVKISGGVTPVGPTPTPTVTDQPYSPLAAPERLLDTRIGAGDVKDAGTYPAYQGGGATTSVQLVTAGRQSTPSTAASVFLNVTVVQPSAEGYVTVFPCGQAQPNASNLNFKAGDVVANAVMAKVGSAGSVCLFSSVPTNLLVDIAGYFPTTDSFTPLANPVRLMETRNGATPTVDGQAYGAGTIASGSTTHLAIANRGGLPASLASVAVNVTAVNGQADGGYLTVFPCGSQPDASNVNYNAGQTIPNLVIAKVSAGGEVCIFNYGKVDLLVDAIGYFSTSVSYSPLAAPARFLNTRVGGATADMLPAATGIGQLAGGGSSYQLLVGGRNAISSSAGAVLMTVTVTNPQSDGYLTVFPCGQTKPEVSNVNFKAGQTIANSVAAGVGTGKNVCIFTSATADVIVDVAGTLS